MKNSIKAWIISAAFASVPLNMNADDFGKDQDILKGKTDIELFTTLKDSNRRESIDLKIPTSVVVDAMLNYFDEEVKSYKLSPFARVKITSILNAYFGSHNVFVVDDSWRMKLVISNKKDFSMMVKDVVNVVLKDMPFLVRKVWIPLFFGWNDAIQRKLDNLDATLFNMKEKQYKEIVFDYLAGIIKRIAININWKFSVWDYYGDISRYYPNNNWKQILQDLNNSGWTNLDIKSFKYKK